ncbi:MULTISPECIES: DinB family protein [unclassified Pseudovibrio]|uniref:DinB family protein n=1 Tax=unclassified Pseudovibrio TaxID=2627060 RepID=UPI0007AE5911|nr:MULTISPECIES: DinB family protein [unclassified Pseudovibrio]
MTVLQYFQAQAKNNTWANYRLLSSCKKLSEDELAAKRTSFFPSILMTLNHILTVDWFYISALEGAPLGINAFDPEYPFEHLSLLFEAQRNSDQKLIAHIGSMDLADLSKIHVLRVDKPLSERADRLLLHLFQHQMHHRGQVHAMLSGTSVAPPQLDEFFLSNEMEQQARKDDFAALGFCETDIWPDRG